MVNHRRGNGGRWWREYYCHCFEAELTAATGSTFTAQNLRIDTDANFEALKNTYTATNDRIKIKAKDSALGRYIIKDPVDVKTIAGRNTLPMGLSNSFIPFIWPRPYLVSAGANLVIEASDASSATNTLYFSIHGAKIRPGIAPWDPDYNKFRAVVPFMYTFTDGAQTVSANTAQAITVEIDVDAHFVVQKVTGIRTGAATLTVTEGVRGREWSSAAMHIDNFVGNGAFPNILTANRFLHRGTTLTFNITDTSGSDNVIEIVLTGLKLYV